MHAAANARGSVDQADDHLRRGIAAAEMAKPMITGPPTRNWDLRTDSPAVKAAPTTQVAVAEIVKRIRLSTSAANTNVTVQTTKSAIHASRHVTNIEVSI